MSSARKRIGDFFSSVVAFSRKYPLSRGMASYAIIYPFGSFIQQTLEGREEYDSRKLMNFCLYGSCYVAPTLNLWMKTASHMWPQNNLASAVAKGLVEQISYTPFAMTSFYFFMSLLEGKSFKEARREVEEKFLPTLKVGVCVWPVLQTINYTMVPEKNRVPFVSLCSIMWTSFLAYMKYLTGNHFNEPQDVPMSHERKH